MTFYFYQINKTQIVRFKIVAIRRRVIDPAADTRVTNNPFAADGDVSAIPNAVLATDINRLQIEEIGRASELARVRASNQLAGGAIGKLAATEVTPLSEALKARALAQVDQSLQKQGLIDKQGRVTEQTVAELSFERISSLPTPGLLVKGCLDECDICEPSVDRAIELDLERKALENELLKKQIELLEKSSEYRCYPVGESEETAGS